MKTSKKKSRRPRSHEILLLLVLVLLHFQDLNDNRKNVNSLSQVSPRTQICNMSESRHLPLAKRRQEEAKQVRLTEGGIPLVLLLLLLLSLSLLSLLEKYGCTAPVRLFTSSNPHVSRRKHEVRRQTGRSGEGPSRREEKKKERKS